MFAGNEITLNFTAKKSDGTILNLSGLGIEWAIARTNSSPVLLLKTLAGGGVTVRDAAAGLFSVVIPPSDTEKFFGDYYPEAKVTDGTKPYTVYAGPITFEPTLL